MPCTAGAQGHCHSPCSTLTQQCALLNAIWLYAAQCRSSDAHAKQPNAVLVLQQITHITPLSGSSRPSSKKLALAATLPALHASTSCMRSAPEPWPCRHCCCNSPCPFLQVQGAQAGNTLCTQPPYVSQHSTCSSQQLPAGASQPDTPAATRRMGKQITMHKKQHAMRHANTPTSSHLCSTLSGSGALLQPKQPVTLSLSTSREGTAEPQMRCTSKHKVLVQHPDTIKAALAVQCSIAPLAPLLMLPLARAACRAGARSPASARGVSPSLLAAYWTETTATAIAAAAAGIRTEHWLG
jgi:hypothetical protein